MKKWGLIVASSALMLAACGNTDETKENKEQSEVVKVEEDSKLKEVLLVDANIEHVFKNDEEIERTFGSLNQKNTESDEIYFQNIYDVKIKDALRGEDAVKKYLELSKSDDTTLVDEAIQTYFDAIKKGKTFEVGKVTEYELALFTVEIQPTMNYIGAMSGGEISEDILNNSFTINSISIGTKGYPGISATISLEEKINENLSTTDSKYISFDVFKGFTRDESYSSVVLGIVKKDEEIVLYQENVEREKTGTKKYAVIEF